MKKTGTYNVLEFLKGKGTKGGGENGECKMLLAFLLVCGWKE